MSANPSSLSDAELEVARLEIDDPLSLPNLSFDRPPADLSPEIVGEYHLSSDSNLMWCCHCQGHHHRNGFVITNETGRHFLLGSKCGPDHYGLSFTLARTEHRSKVRRKGVLDRLKAIVATSAVVKATIREVLHSEGLRMVDQKREELRRASEAAFNALATSVATEMPLSEVITVRDLIAEQQRDAQLPGDKTGPPIYVEQRRAIGRVSGAGMLRDRADCRDHLLALKAAIERVEALHKDITDNFHVKVLTNAVRAAEQAWEAAQSAIVEAEAAPGLFTDENFARLERWTATNRYFQLFGDGERLLVKDGSRQTVIEPLPSIKLTHLPRMKVD